MVNTSEIIILKGTCGKLSVTCQYQENYNWEGEGDGSPRWKMKGGDSFIIDPADIKKFVNDPKIIYEDKVQRQYICHSEILQEDFVFEIPDYVDPTDREWYIGAFCPQIWPKVE
jgi:hypothetical protein